MKKAPDFSRAFRNAGTDRSSYDLDVVVKLELRWVWTEADVVHFVLTLVGDPSFDEILGEYATAGEVLMILFEVVEYF